MIFAVDYDGTITADKELFKVLMTKIASAGHEVLIVTMRTPEEGLEEEHPFPVIYTSRVAKGRFCFLHGYKVDIWIDDNPHWILEDAF